MMLHSEQEHSMAALTARTLTSLDDRVPTPTYDRTQVSPASFTSASAASTARTRRCTTTA